MGNYTSKLFYHGNHDKSKESNVSSLILENCDTCTPQPQKKNLVNDPRSATTGIIRTPIEVKKFLFYNYLHFNKFYSTIKKFKF